MEQEVNKCKMALRRVRLALEEGKLRLTPGQSEYVRRTARALIAYNAGNEAEFKKWLHLAFQGK